LSTFSNKATLRFSR